MVNKIFSILTWFVFIISGLLSLVFIFVEGRMLFVADWLVYSNQALGFFKVFFKLFLAIILLGISVLQILNIFYKKKAIFQVLYLTNIGLLIASILMCVFAANFVGEIFLILTILIVVLKTAEGTYFLFLKNK